MKSFCSWSVESKTGGVAQPAPPPDVKRTRRPPIGGSKWFAHLPIWGGGGYSRKLMLSSNLLKSKIPMCGGGTYFQLLMLSPNLLKKMFCEKFSKFSGKKHNGFVLDFEYQVVPLYKVQANHNKLTFYVFQPFTPALSNRKKIRNPLYIE